MFGITRSLKEAEHREKRLKELMDTGIQYPVALAKIREEEQTVRSDNES